MATKAAIGGTTLLDAGLKLATGNGTSADWGYIQRARKEHRCGHSLPNARRLTTECAHRTIAPGEPYLLTRQGYLDTEPLALDCALAAGVVESLG
jgi:hypothetical protein